MKRHCIGVVTTSRADYGLLYWLLRAIHEDEELALRLYVTGSHLSEHFGLTVREIEKDGLPIHRRVPILTSNDSPTAVTTAIARAAEEFGKAFAEDDLDIVVLLGDRFEILPIAQAAVVHGVPVAHIHGGETSEGALDEYFRHAVTKLSLLHFPATDAYRRRILQMGEAPERVHNFGAPGLDHLHRTALLTREQLQQELGLDLGRPTALVTYHPVTTEPHSAADQVTQLLRAIESEATLQAVFTRANADNEGRIINALLEQFCSKRPERYRLFDNLGTLRYLSCLKHLDLVIGNSSSGLIEAPSFRRPVVNVGNRQRGRIMAANVIQTDYSEASIRQGIATALSASFRDSLADMRNPYDRFGDGRVSERIAACIKTFVRNPGSLKKPFIDMPQGSNYDQ